MEHIKATMTQRGLVLDTNAEQLAMSLKTYRLRHGMTQQQLAEKWGCSRYTIMRLETMKRVTWEMTYKIFNLLLIAIRAEEEPAKYGLDPQRYALHYHN